MNQFLSRELISKHMIEKFDKIINQKISESKIAPSKDLWSKIEAELDEKDNKKIVLFPFWQNGLFKQVAAAAVIFLLGGITANIFFNDNSTSLNGQFSKESNTNNALINEGQNSNAILKTNSLATNEVVSTENQEVSNSEKITNTNFVSTTATKTATTTTIIRSSNTTKKSNHFGMGLVGNTPSANSNANNNTLMSNSLANNSTNEYLSASDYNWIYDEETGAYEVVLKQENELLNNSFLINNAVNKNSSNGLLANETNSLDAKKEGETSMMSLIEKEQDEEIETVELNEEEDSYKQFKTKAVKLNYKGFWLGPNVGYESLFVGGVHYPGGSFGVDLGYDFGGSFGIQTGVKYAINSKVVGINNSDGNPVEYKSEMNSVHVPLLFRYKFTKLTQKYSKPLSLNLLAGADYSFIDRKGLHQLGFVVGTEYDIFTQADLMFTIGLRGGVYNNLNRNQIVIPETLTPLNYTLSAYIAIRFIDWAKKS